MPSVGRSYEAYAPVDAYGTFSQTKLEAGDAAGRSDRVRLCNTASLVFRAVSLWPAMPVGASKVTLMLAFSPLMHKEAFGALREEAKARGW